MIDETNPEAGMTLPDVLAKLDNASKALQYWKGEESRLRYKIAAVMFPNAVEGTQYFALGGPDGNRLKLTHKLNYTLSNTTNVLLALDAAEKLGLTKEEGQRLVRWKPDLSISEYRALDKSQLLPIKLEIDKVLTISPGMPTLEVVGPAK